MAQTVKNLPTWLRSEFDPWVRKIPWKRKWEPISVFLSGKYHGQKSLEGYSSWGHNELDTTEQLTLNLPPTLHISPRAGHKFLPSVPSHDLRTQSSNQEAPWPGHQPAFAALPTTAAQSLFPAANDTSQASHYLWATPELPQINCLFGCFLLSVLPFAPH